MKHNLQKTHCGQGLKVRWGCDEDQLAGGCVALLIATLVRISRLDFALSWMQLNRLRVMQNCAFINKRDLLVLT